MASLRYFTEQRIVDHRQKEQSMINIDSKLKQEFHEKTLADWENKGQDILQRKFVNKKISQFQQRSQAMLEQRRAKLRSKLQSEHESYKVEIKDLEDTPAIVRQRMRNELALLKEQKQQEQQEYVKFQRDRQFKQNTDEIRGVNKNYLQLKTNYERQLQMLDKQQNQVDEYNEELIFTELYKRELRQKQIEEEKRKNQHKQQQLENQHIVKIQQDQMHQNKQIQKDIQFKERIMLQKEWQRQIEDEKIAEQQKIHQQIQLNRQTIDENKIQQKMKEQHKINQKLDDQKMVQSVIAREKLEDEYDRQKREEHRIEQQKLIRNMTKTVEDMKQHQILFDQQLKVQNDQQWKKRYDVWKAEEEKKVKLMYEVYNDRAEVLKQKKEQKIQHKVSVKQEKQEILEQLQVYDQQDQSQRYNDTLKNKNYQSQLLSQIDQKQLEKKEKIHMIKQQDILDQELVNQKLRKIDQEKQLGTQMLNSFKESRRF